MISWTLASAEFLLEELLDENLCKPVDCAVAVLLQTLEIFLHAQTNQSWLEVVHEKLREALQHLKQHLWLVVLQALDEHIMNSLLRQHFNLASLNRV